MFSPEKQKTVKTIVFVTGTDPSTSSGGIGFVMSSFLKALASADVKACIIPTYRPNSFIGKFLPWISGLISLVWKLILYKFKDANIAVYSHPGGGVALIREGILLFVCRLLRVPSMVQVHAPEIDFYLNRRLGRFAIRFAFLGASRLCVLTPWWKKRLEKYVKKRIVVIPDPLPTHLENRASEIQAASSAESGTVHCNISHQSCHVLTMARLVEGKGVDKVIRAISLLPTFIELTIAGDGKQRKQLESLASELNIGNRVKFVGWVEETEKENLFRSSDIFCLPSKLDSFGMVFLEAMAHGLPVIALNFQSTHYVVPHNKAGVLLDDDNPENLAAVLERLVADIDYRKKLGEGGKHWIINEFSVKTIGSKLKSVIHELMPNQ